MDPATKTIQSKRIFVAGFFGNKKGPPSFSNQNNDYESSKAQRRTDPARSYLYSNFGEN